MLLINSIIFVYIDNKNLNFLYYIINNKYLSIIILIKSICIYINKKY